MKNNLRKITYIFIVFCVIFISLKNVYAVTEEELRNQQTNIENQINNAHTEIAGIEEELSITLKQINRLNVQINEKEDELKNAKENLEKINQELENKKKELKKAQDSYNKQKKLLETRLVAMYESSRTTYLDILFESKDISDFISKYYLLEQIAECDNEVLEELKISRLALEAQNLELEKDYKNAEDVQEKLENQTNAMNVLINDKNNLVLNLNEEEKMLENQLEQFEQDKKRIEEELIEVIRQNAIKASVTPSNCGYISPLLGKTKLDITTGYRGYVGHTGVDFAIPSNTDIVAVKSGTVVISDALKNSNGSYRSYGEHVVINHHDGTMTLYAHGLADSRMVQPGDEVEQGQVIMKSGSTGNSTGPHLHFEVRVNGKCVEPSQYLP